jgi:hypothetical protein
MYDKNNLGWRLYLLQKRLQEWWELQTTQAWQKVEGAPLFDWLDSEVVRFMARVAFWAILALVVIWAGGQLINGLSRYVYRLRKDSSPSLLRVNQTEFKSLDSNAWLRESLHFEQQGNYREACLSLYRGMLQLLHDRGIAPHQESRTDGEYLNLVSYLPQWLSCHTLIMTHQRLCFGRVDASPSLFQDCLQAYREIERL